LLGDRKTEIETPSLCLDLSRFEANVERVADVARAAGKNWRPRAQCHKSPEIASYQIRQGAIGITCAKVSEAEAFASAGIPDILIAHPPVGTRRIQRIATLCKTATPIVTCDHYVQAEALSRECVQQGVQCRALVEINVGMDRTGVRPGRDALELACGIEKLSGLKLAGIMGYEGHVMPLSDPDVKRRQIDAAMGILASTCEIYLQNGLCCDIVSASGTGSFQESIRCESLTEIQAGGAVFGDPYYSRMPDVDGLRSALTVLATVVSRPGFDRAVLDAGRKAITAEFHPPIVKNWDDAKVIIHCAEHIVLKLGPSSRELRIGDQVELIVGYADLTCLMYDEFLGFRNDRLEVIWPILARSKLI
jgi:D-serine deaminase-like pyridoxal phosphate-dependent protein